MPDDIINILNLKPTDVQSCTTKKENNCIYYFITLIRKEYICPKCHHKLYIKDYSVRHIKHEIIRGMKTFIHFKQRRFFCPHCRSYHYEDNPFSVGPKIQLSDRTCMEVMRFLKEHSSTFSMASRQFNISPTKVVEIFDLFGQMRKNPLPEVLSIDEFYWNRRSKTKYACLLLDFKTGDVIDIINGRTLKIWNSYAQLLDKKDINRVKYLCIDMFETYRQVHHIYFPKSILCVDSFHIIKNINQLLKNERIKVMKRYDTNTVEYYLLKNFNWLLMRDSVKIEDNKAKYNKKLSRYINYPALLEMLLEIDPILKEAYELKELYLIFNQSSNFETARENLAEVTNAFINSNVESFRKFSSTLIDWYEEIINSFIIIDNHRLSNGRIESINSRIKTIIKNANGFRNFSRMRNRIMYCINKNASPSVHKMNETIKTECKPRGRYDISRFEDIESHVLKLQCKKDDKIQVHFYSYEHKCDIYICQIDYINDTCLLIADTYKTLSYCEFFTPKISQLTEYYSNSVIVKKSDMLGKSSKTLLKLLSK